VYPAWDLRYFGHWLVLAHLPDPPVRYTPWALETYIGLWILTDSAISCSREALTQKVLHPPCLLSMKESSRQPIIGNTTKVNSNSVENVCGRQKLLR